MTTQVATMPMRKTLDQLAKTAAVLNKSTDELNEVIADFEQELQDAGVGVTAWLTKLLDEGGMEERFHPSDRNEQYPIKVIRGWQLGFARVDGDWRVAARFVRSEESGAGREFFEERAAIPLAKAPRVVRVEAAPLLEHLAENLTEQMADYIEGIEKAKAMAKAEDDEDDQALRRVANKAWPAEALKSLLTTLRDQGSSQQYWVIDATEVKELADTDLDGAHEALDLLARAKKLVRVSEDGWTLPEIAERFA